jgi:plastocyanin
MKAISADAFSAVDGAADVTERVVAATVNHFAREWCTLPDDLEAGRYNYTVTVDAGTPNNGWKGELGFGDAQFYELGRMGGVRDMARPSSNGDGAAYVLTVIPTIDTVSTSVSGSNGGDEVVVTGTGFHASTSDCSANKVVLAGANCVVKAPCTATELTCITTNATFAEPGPNFSGTSGLRAAIFTGNTNGRSSTVGWELESFYTAPYDEFVTIGGTDSLDILSESVREQYNVEERGYFVPPTTTDYRFYAYGDDVVAVYLDLNDLGFVNMTQMAFSGSHSSTFYKDSDQQIGAPVLLEAGKRYPIMTRFIEWGGADFWMVGVEQMNSTRHEDMFQYQRVNEIQRVYLAAEATRQVEKITLAGITGGSMTLIGAVDANTGLPRVSTPIEVTNVKNRQNQLYKAFADVYRHGEYGRNCRDYSVAVVEDAVGSAGTITFAVTINCRPATDPLTGDAIPFTKPVFDVSNIETTDGAVLHNAEADFAVSAVNVGFEDELPDTVGGYTKKTALPGWSITNNVYIVSNGNAAWGGLSSEKGEGFVSIQRAGSAISQVLTGLDAGVEYSLKFLVAGRNGNRAELRATVDGVEIMGATAPPAWFSEHYASFVASGPTATITFENVSPGGDRSVFVDEIHIAKALYLEGADAVVSLNVEMDVPPSNPLGGRFQFTMESHCAQVNCTVYGTPLMNWNHGSGKADEVLTALPNIQQTRSSVAYYIDSDTNMEVYWYEVEFVTPKGVDHPPLGVHVQNLYGDGLKTWTETRFDAQPDSVLHLPIPDDMLEVASDAPSATVRVNGINARCTDESGGGCQFVYDDAMTGLIDEVSSDVGTTITVGSTLTIRGQRLQHAGRGATVTFGGGACDVTAHSETEIQCTVGHSSYGVYYPVVTVHGTGAATLNGGVPEMTYSYQIDAISPLSSGVRGGSKVTLTGTGFDDKEMASNDITIGGAACKVLSATHSKVVCLVPEMNGVMFSTLEHNGDLNTTADVPIAVGFFDGFEFGTNEFTYSWDETPSLTTMSPTFTSAARTATVLLTVESGVGYANNGGKVGECTPSMALVSPSGVERICERLEVNDDGNVFTCVLVRAEPLPLDEQPLMFPRLQLCSSSGEVVVAHPAVAINTFDLALRVTATTPATGSIAGGTQVVISGAGFVDLSEMIVRSALTYNYYDVMTIVNIALPDRMVGCAISAASYNTIECITTMPESNAAVVTADAKHDFIDDGGDGLGYNGKIAVSINDFPVPGCGSDPDAPADMRDGAWGAWNTSTEHTYATPLASGRMPYVCEFDYAEASSAVISSVEPAQGSGATSLTITGSGFTAGGNPTVMVGATECNVEAATDSKVECNIPPMTSGRYAIRVDVPSTGFAAHPADAENAVEFVSQIVFAETTPRASSLRGGLVITIHGHGFSDTLDSNTVSIGGHPAHLVFANHSQIVAVTPVAPYEPVPCGIVEPCNSPEHYIQISYQRTVCGGGLTCVSVNEATGELEMQLCDTSSSAQLFRMEQAPVANEYAYGHKESGVFRLRPFGDDTMCLQAPFYASQCDPYSFQKCSDQVDDQQFHLAEYAESPKVFNFAGGNDKRSLTSDGGCSIGTPVMHCGDNGDDKFHERFKFGVEVSTNATGLTTPSGNSVEGVVQVVVEADVQADYAYGQIKPVARTVFNHKQGCGAFGGEFVLVFRQTAGKYLAKDAWMAGQNAGNDTADTYSILDELENYRKVNGEFEFKLIWPEHEGTNSQQWIQKSNPATSTHVAGYKEVDVPFTTSNWDGLSRSSDASTLLDGSSSHTHWYYAVGSNNEYEQGGVKGMPGPDWVATVTELWACNEGDAVVANAAHVIDWNFDTTREQASVTVEVGSTVTWAFSLDEVIGGTHKFVSGKPGVPDGHFESRLLPQQGVWEHTFNQTGDFHYYSDPLGFLAGTISVRDNVLESPAAYRLRSDLHCARAGECSIDYSTRITPIISAIQPATGQQGERLTITGTGLVSTDGLPTEVLIGAIECEVDSATATSVECVIGEVPGGLHTVFLTVGGEGTARTSGGMTIHPSLAKRTFSSVWDDSGYWEDSMMSSDRGWLPNSGKKKGAWLQLELDDVTLLAGVQTMGRVGHLWRTTKYEVLTSLDGIEWSEEGIFAGNLADSDLPVTNRFNKGVYAKYVRFVAIDYVEVPALRAALVVPTLSFESKMTVASVSVDSGSFGGGTTVVVTGAGFGSPDASANGGGRVRRDGAWGGWVIYDGEHDNHGPKELGSKVQLCSSECVVTESSYNEITCVTSPFMSIDALTTYDHVDRALLVGARTFSSNNDDSATSELAFDREFTNKFQQDGAWYKMDYITDTNMYGSTTDRVNMNTQGLTGIFNANMTLPRQSTWRLTTSLHASAHGCADPLENWILMINGEHAGKAYNYPLNAVHEIAHEFTGDSFDVKMIATSKKSTARYCHSYMQSYTLEDIGTEPRTPSCHVGMDLGEGERAVVSRFRFFPPHQEAPLTDGGYFQTSANKQDWATLATISDPHQGWNWVDANITEQAPARYIRYVGPAGGRCEMTQLEFYGFQAGESNSCTVEVSSTNPRSHPAAGPMSTDHRVISNVESDFKFTFEHDLTGVVTAIHPRFGSSLGNELITVIGKNLATTVDDAMVMLNGKMCVIQSVESDGTAIECITSPRGKLNEMKPLSLVVSNAASGMGDAISMQTVRYRYLDRWSAVNSWLNDEPPVAGDSVIIPEDQTILMDISPPRLNWLQVNGMLVFDRQDLNLDATYILVYGGTLEVGTEDEPFMQQATITLHGDRRETVELPFVGSKVLAVADKGGFTTFGKGRGVDVPLSQKGILDIHGIPRLRTWTKVGATVEAGTKTITTIEPTDFAMGEKVVLTAPHQELTVANRIDNYTFTVVETITNRHVSETRDHAGFDTMDMTCEVALLSRNIVIQGAGLNRLDGSATIEEGDDEVPSQEQLFGVHTGAFHGGHYRVENTELRHCGQAGNLGRYCMHFHVNDDNPAPNSYIKSNSIHHSFQRATTVHGTHHALVQNNVAYHVMGHTYFVEDGDETFNTFDGNIGIFTKPSHMMLKSDKQPSTFWTAIPTNYWRNNIATDCTDRGAWFELENQGITLEFHNNTFHNNGGIGFRNYPNYSPPSAQYFTNNTYYKNGGNGLFYKKGGDNHHVHSKFAENGVDIFWTKYSTHAENRLIPNVKDCLFWGGRNAQAIFAPQNEYWYVDGATFIDYEDTGAISGCAGCCSPQKFKQGGYTYRFENLKFINTPARTRWTCPYKQIFYDLDGSLTGYAGGTTLPYYQFNDWEGDCEMDDTGTFDKGHRGMVCNDKVRVRRLQLEGNEPRELDNKRVFFKKSQMVSPILNAKVDRYGKSDKFGAVDWKQYSETGKLFEGCVDTDQKALKGYCMWAGKDQNKNVQKYVVEAGSTLALSDKPELVESECLAWCRTIVGATGCEQILTGGSVGCYVHKDPVDQASGNSNHLCWLFPQTDVTDSSLLKTPLHFSGCVGLDGLDFINYRNAGTVSGEFDGWAIPMVTHHDYYADMDWHIDWQRIKMRWSEPFYFQEPYNKPLDSESGSPESALIRWPYVDYRYRYRTSYAGIQGYEKAWYDNQIPEDASEMKQLTRFDDFGASSMIREDDSLKTTGAGGEFLIAMNPWNGVEVDKLSNAYKVDLEALQCAPSMCGLPGDNKDCMQADGKTWDTNKCKPLRWSQKETWTALQSKQLNTASITHTGVAPQDGDSIEIPQNTLVILDVDNCPLLDMLVVTGRLVVEAGSANKVRRLEANRMLVWGELQVGTESAPYNAGDFEIKLHGVRTSDTLVAVEHHFLGNKNLVVFGDVRLHGIERTTMWTTLASTAGPGSTEIKLDSDVASTWTVSDKIVITGTEYPAAIGFEDDHTQAFLEDYMPHQAEVRTITSIAGDTVTFDEPLANRHFAGVINATGGVTVELKAHVGLLSHNVRVTGDLTDSPVAGRPNWYSGYGGHIVVGEANYGNYTEEELLEMQESGENLGVVRKLGSMVATGVEFKDLGKLASEHPVLQYRYFSDLKGQTELIPENRIEGCSFVNSWNYVVATERSTDVQLINNVMHRSFRTAIDIDLGSVGLVLKNNLVSSIHRSPDAYTPACKKDKSCWNFPFAGINVWNTDFTEVSGNVVAGSEDIGFMMYPVDTCDQSEPARINNNEAYGALVGQYILSNAGNDECRVVSPFKAWKNAHLGVVAVDQQASIKVIGLKLADNHLGISLNFVKTGWESFSTIEDSAILGSTAASVGGVSSICRAVKMGDTRGLGCNSEFGTAWRRVGIVMPQYTNLAKTCEHTSAGGVCRPPNKVFRICSLPWENRFGNVNVQHATMEITNTVFAHWKTSDDGAKSRAIALNPSQPDFAPRTTLSDITWDSATVDATARFQLGDASYQTNEATACNGVMGSCDAVNYFTVVDADGSTMAPFWNDGSDVRGERFTILSAFNPAIARADKCISDASTQSIVCRDYNMIRLVLESDPPRFVKRRLGPATITKYSDTPKYEAADNRTSFSVGPFPQGCSCQKHFAQFTMEVEAGLEYDLFTTAVLQDKNRISFNSPNSSDCIVAKIMFSKPNAIEVFEATRDGGRGELIPRAESGVYPTATDVSGTNLHHPQERMLYVTLCGGENNAFWMDYTSTIQVTATLAMTVDAFFATEDPNSRTTGMDSFVTNVALLLGIPHSQIKVACVHYVGQPCIPLRRARRATGDDAAVDESVGLEVEFEIAAPETALTDAGEETSFGSDETRDYLTNLVGDMEELIESGAMAEQLDSAGFKGLEMAVSYDDIVTTTTTTTTATATATATVTATVTSTT